MSTRGRFQTSLDYSRHTISTFGSATSTYLPTPISGAPAWKRNPAWLTLPTVLASDQRVVILTAIFMDSNFAAINATINSGQYTVDWGDGSSTTNNSSVAAEHQYDYTNSALNGTDGPVTFTASTSTVNRNSHGYSNGDQVRFYNIVTTTGITQAQYYYVINATTNTFQISSTSGGSAVTLTNDGSASLLPYKQAIISITPTTANLTSLSLGLRHSKLGINAYSQPWLDVTVALPNANTTGVTMGGGNMAAQYMEQANILSIGAQTSLQNFFSTSINLASVYLPNGTYTTNSVTNFSGLFLNCYNLRSAPMFDTSRGTNFSNMFIACMQLTTIPQYDTRSATSMGYMFSNCYNLQNIPTLNAASCTDFTNMFANCYSLVNAPMLLNMSSPAGNISCQGMFGTCYSLQTVPLYNTSKCTNFVNMFYGCQSLKTVPLFDLSSATAVNAMFQSCASLVSIPTFNTINVTNFTSMFILCTSLQTVPPLNTSNGVTFTSMFQSCSSITTYPAFNTSKGTAFNNMFSACFNLEYAPVLDTSRALTVSGMYQNTSGLKNAPILNTSNVTDFSSMFASSYITNAPYMDTGNGTNFSYMFNGCPALETIPLYNTANGTNFTHMFSAGTSNLSVASGSTSSLVSIPALNFSNAANINATPNFNGCFSLTKMSGFGLKVSANVNNYAFCKFSKTALEEILTNLGIPATTQTINFAGPNVSLPLNWGYDYAVTKSCTTSVGNTTVLCSTANVSTDNAKWISGTGLAITDAPAVTFQTSGNTVTFSTAGLSVANNTSVSFSTITTTTGISLFTPYYVVNSSGNVFQVSTTQGGSALPLTNNGNGNVLFGTQIVGVVANTSYTLSNPVTSSGTNTLSLRYLNTSIGTLKNWTVT